MRLSFSKLALYEFCPYAYRFRYIERVPTPFAPWLTVGAIVHTVLHRAFERMRDGVRLTRADLHELHAAYWRNAPGWTASACRISGNASMNSWMASGRPAATPRADR